MTIMKKHVILSSLDLRVQTHETSHNDEYEERRREEAGDQLVLFI